MLCWITEVKNLLYCFFFFSAAGDINAPASAQANKTFLPWETHLFTRLLKYGKQSESELFLNVTCISEINKQQSTMGEF